MDCRILKTAQTIRSFEWFWVIKGRRHFWRPSGLVLGPLLFLLFINDISEGILSHLRLYTDDCVLYKPISCEDACRILQCDLSRIAQWCCKWNMNLNLDKTVIMSFSRKKKTCLFQYTLDNIALSRVSLYKYLGVYFTTDLKWHRHVDHIIANAGKALGLYGATLKTSVWLLKSYSSRRSSGLSQNMHARYGTHRCLVTRNALKEYKI